LPSDQPPHQLELRTIAQEKSTGKLSALRVTTNKPM